MKANLRAVIGTYGQLAVALAGGAVVLGTAVVSPRSAAGNDVSELKVTIQEWAVPTKGAHPHDPAVRADGALWFTEQMQNKIGRVDPAAGTSALTQ